MKSNKINEQSIITKMKDIEDTDLDGEKVMMNMEKGKYFAMNEVGSRIWVMLDQPISIENIVSTLLKEYSVSEEVCKNEVLDFVNKIYEEGLVQIA